MDTNRNEWLYAKCLDGTATETERAELLSWLALHENEPIAKEWLLSVIVENDGLQSFDEEKTEAMLQAIFNAEPAPVFKWKWWAAAASILVILGAAWWWMDSEKAQPVKPVIVQTEILPAKQGAVLTLADGSQLVLD